jgi:hypothetical protein
MVTITPRRIRFGAFLLSAAASLSSGSALADLTSCAAGSVCYYVAIQPIDVCASNGTGCAPFNNLSKTGNPGAATSTTPIGFVDTTTKKDITRAIMNQIGVDVAWSPIKQYNNTTYQTLRIVPCSSTNPVLPCASTPNALTSTDFLTLSQQNGISQGTATPTSPLALQPTVVNMFFVNSLTPPQGSGTLYGFSWIGNNGIAISASTFFPPFPLTPRFDTLAHELGHNLGLDHSDLFNPISQGSTTPSPTDVMTVGTSRTEPGSTSIAIADLANASADQLNKTVQPTQNSAIAVSGFLNPIASSTTNVTTPGNGTITTALVVSDTAGNMTITAAPNSTKPNTSLNFDVNGPTSGRDGETLIGLIVTLGNGLHFDPTNKVQFKVNSGFVTSAIYDHGNTGDANCPDPATQCLLIQLSNPGLPIGQDLFFTQGIVGAPGQVGSQGKTVTLDNLVSAGVNITYKFSDGLIITSTLTGSSTQGFLSANSQNPSSTVGTQIDPAIFASVVGAPPCTPTVSFDGTVEIIGACPDPYVTGVSDGNPSEEGGQLGGGG